MQRRRRLIDPEGDEGDGDASGSAPGDTRVQTGAIGGNQVEAPAGR
jgi:hypothetical protein